MQSVPRYQSLKSICALGEVHIAWLGHAQLNMTKALAEWKRNWANATANTLERRRGDPTQNAWEKRMTPHHDRRANRRCHEAQAQGDRPTSELLLLCETSPALANERKHAGVRTTEAMWQRARLLA
jgi:hypothetical protein